MSIKAIETSYSGYKFRSRLEARWAVFFDSLGLKWEYEPEGFESNGFMYLPDFRVLYPGRCEDEARHVWFEVKSSLKEITQSEIDKMLACMPGVIILDGVPAKRMYSSAEDLFGDGWFPVSKVYSSAQDLFQKTCPDFGEPNPEAVDRSFWSLRIFGDYGNALYSSKGRLWVDYAKNFFDDRGIEYPGSSGYEIETAVNAARSARFEHGRKGAR